MNLGDYRRRLWLKLKELSRVCGLKRKLSDSTEYSNNEASTSVQGSSDNSTCGLLRRLQILSSRSSSNHEMSWEVENERGESPPYNSPNGEEFGEWGDESYERVEFENSGSDLDVPPPLEASESGGDSGVSNPSTSTVGNLTTELIDITDESESKESGIEGGERGNGGTQRPSWIVEGNSVARNLKNVAEVVASMAHRY